MFSIVKVNESLGIQAWKKKKKQLEVKKNKADNNQILRS